VRLADAVDRHDAGPDAALDQQASSATTAYSLSTHDHVLDAALARLPIGRLRRLVDGLERDPDIEVTVGAWRPQCPMVIAGFDPGTTEINTAEEQFAFAWDSFAEAQAGDPSSGEPVSAGPARQSDVQTLLRMATAQLAHRMCQRRMGNDEPIEAGDVRRDRERV